MSAAPPIATRPPQTAPPPAAPAGRWKYHASMLAFAATVLLAAGLLNVADGRVQVPGIGRLPATCAWQRMFAMDCPGCGLTRCFVALGHGEITRAWHFNPAGLLLFGVVLYQFPFRLLQLWRLRQGMNDYRHGMVTVQVVVWGAVATLLLQWFWRVIL